MLLDDHFDSDLHRLNAASLEADGLFWEMHRLIPTGSISTSLRAFKYLTSGKCDTDAHFHLFSVAQEQRIFRDFGVDEDHLKDALRRPQRHLDLRGPEKGDEK